MHPPPPHPELTPQFCFNTTVLKDFLRLSRGSIDDNITENLNALITPPGFDPTSTSTRNPRQQLNKRIPASSCKTFKNEVLFPHWKARSNVLNYCASVATSPDPDDPEAVLRQLESDKDKQRIVDERLDPYSARFFPREARTERLAAVVRQERGVESIVRARSWKMVGERCGEDWREWEEAMGEWEKEVRSKQFEWHKTKRVGKDLNEL